jgi:Cu/Ag efflux protein CusF
MKSFMKCVGAMAAIVLVAGVATAADNLATGKVKGVDADKKEFVLTGSDGKDTTFRFGENVVINRGHKEGTNDLKAGDAVNVAYDKGVRTWTAQYVLIQEGDSKNCELVRCTVKNYDADTKVLTYTDNQGKDSTIGMGESKVRLNGQDSKVQDVKIGDKALAIVQRNGEKSTLMDFMAERK